VKVAVVGHVEWADCAEVDRLPRPGEIVQAEFGWDVPAGGGAVAAVQLAKLAGECLFLTALGDDELGHRAERGLADLGVRVAAAWRGERQRRAFVHLSADDGERTITVLGDRLGPHAGDDLPWEELEEADAVYFTAGDAGAVVAAGQAGSLVATARAKRVLAAAGTQVDVLVASAVDEGERYGPGDIEPPPRFVARTEGVTGGSLETASGERTHWTAAPLPGPVIDTYGAGDSFAAGLTYGLADGRSMAEALELGARCGAASVTGRGPYDGQLSDPG